MVRKCVGGGGGETNPIFLFQPFFPKLFGKQVGKKKSAVAVTASERRCLWNRRERTWLGCSILWEALGLQGVNSVARELGLSGWLLMDSETR